MRTVKKYTIDRYLSDLQTKILGLSPSPKNEEDLLVVLEETIFFPGGGGQSCDIGSINGHPVSMVYEADDEIFHLISGGTQLMKDGIFSPGMECEISIDWDRRFDNMQRHCGEHILSGIFYGLYGGVNRGFHMGDDYMTIDISLEDNPEYKEVSWEMAMKAEEKTNQIIWQNLPVIAHHFDTKEEASQIKLRKELTVEEDITIVTIGDESHPADSVACCGTHPSTSGQVGLLKIYKVEPNKGMFRVFFEAGSRALKGYDIRYDILSALEKDLSASHIDIIDKYEARKAKNKDVRDRLYHLTKEIQLREATRIEEALSDGEHIFQYELLTIDDVIEIGRSLSGKIPGILYLICSKENIVLIFSDTADCGKLVKENVSVFNGKGGGNTTFARAIFTRRDDLDMFIDAAEKLTGSN